MACFMPDKLYGVIGWPLAQSLSPLVHNTAFQTLDISSVYMAWPLKDSELETFIKSMKLLKINGCSVTIPHKIDVMPYLDSISEGASLAGAVNTLFYRNDELCGENTDIAGFLAPLVSIDLDHLDVLLLGAGGAAHAVAAALKLRGSRHVRVSSPGNRRQYSLAERFGFSALKWEDRYSQPASLVINSTPLGMKGEHVNDTPYDFDLAPAVNKGMAYDLVYNPLQTVFLREALRSGRQIISGFEMFYGQADAQFFIWTGQHLPKESRVALERILC